MILIEMSALFFCGAFFGAAVYISMAQHPATMTAGIAFASQFFPPMYDLASRLQIALAVGGTLAGAILWYQTQDSLWALGAALLFLSSRSRSSCSSRSTTNCWTKVPGVRIHRLKTCLINGRHGIGYAA